MDRRTSGGNWRNGSVVSEAMEWRVFGFPRPFDGEGVQEGREVWAYIWVEVVMVFMDWILRWLRLLMR